MNKKIVAFNSTIQRVELKVTVELLLFYYTQSHLKTDILARGIVVGNISMNCEN